MDAKGVKPMPDGMGMPSMMQQMMKRMCCQGDFSPAAMCQGMMNSVGRKAETAAYATPEVRKPFEQWAQAPRTRWSPS